MRLAHIVAAVIALSVTALAVDPCSPCVAHLSNGFTISHLRHETVGDTTKLYVSESGFVEVPTAQIREFVQDELPTAVPAQTPATVDDHILRASQNSGVDSDFVRSVIQHESNFNARAVSPKGARGLMQLMPGTARQLGVEDAFDPASNINGGSQYLRDLLVRYNGDAVKALAAYNAGPAAVDRYHGVPPYPETRRYVANVITSYNKRKTAAPTTAKAKNGKSHSQSGQASAAKPNVGQ